MSTVGLAHLVPSSIQRHLRAHTRCSLRACLVTGMAYLDFDLTQANPPYDKQSIQAAFQHILRSLSSASWDCPLSFVLVVPQLDVDMLDSRLHPSVPNVKQFVSCMAHAEPGAHQFCCGMQHHKTGRGEFGETAWVMNKRTSVYVLQNQAGRSLWPCSMDKMERVLCQFHVDPEFGPLVKYTFP